MHRFCLNSNYLNGFSETSLSTKHLKMSSNESNEGTPPDPNKNSKSVKRTPTQEYLTGLPSLTTQTGDNRQPIDGKPQEANVGEKSSGSDSKGESTEKSKSSESKPCCNCNCKRHRRPKGRGRGKGRARSSPEESVSSSEANNPSDSSGGRWVTIHGCRVFIRDKNPKTGPNEATPASEGQSDESTESSKSRGRGRGRSRRRKRKKRKSHSPSEESESSSSGGRWVTIRGNRVFIRDKNGQGGPNEATGDAQDSAKEKSSSSSDTQSDSSGGHWVTIRGRRVFIKDKNPQSGQNKATQGDEGQTETSGGSKSQELSSTLDSVSSPGESTESDNIDGRWVTLRDGRRIFISEREVEGGKRRTSRRKSRKRRRRQRRRRSNQSFGKKHRKRRRKSHRKSHGRGECDCGCHKPETSDSNGETPMS